MKSFLQIVTEDIVRKHGTNLSDVVVVFSNKRASLFMNQYLVDIVDKPLFSPQYKTMSELFRDKSNLMVVDNIRAIHTLYDVYQKIAPSNETIDAFWGWGEILLNDFNDIDKHIGNAKAILSNVRDLHAYDTIDYLSEEDKKMLSQFFAELSEDHDSRLKERFRNLWNKLLDIYQSFNEALKAKNLTYEGAMYREVALRAKDIDWGEKKYIFVGFNMLWETEQRLFSALKEKGLAYFYWDFDYYYTSDTSEEAGIYLRQWLQKYPNELDAKNKDLYDNLSHQKEITYLSAPSEDVQAQYVGEWLKRAERMNATEKTAIVLADERLLKSVVCHLPQEVSSKVSIAMGLPLSETLATTFVDNFLRLHIYNFNVQEQVFVSQQVKTLLNHPYTSLLRGKDEDLTTIIGEDQLFVVGAEALCKNEDLTLLFSPIDINGKDANRVLVERLRALMESIGKALEQERIYDYVKKGINPDVAPITYEEQMKQESVYKMYTLLNPLYDILSKEELTIMPTTLLRLIDQMIAQSSMAFHGEPITELYITGILESRNLDFDHVLVLSCNEGNMPKSVHTSSFIPYIVRKAYGLTTPEDRMAVEAYYFYHLIQRCDDLSFAFNSSTEDGKTGQMSQFMLQLMVDEKSNYNPRQVALTSKQMPYDTPNEVKKTPEVMKILDAITSLSPSAINNYLRCHIQFYYKYVAGIKEPDNNDFDDDRTFGNIFHRTAENLYEEMKDAKGIVSKESIERILKEKDNRTILRNVEEAISHELFNGKQLRYDGLLLIERDVMTYYTRLLLESDKESAPLTIVGLERKIGKEIPINVDGKERSIEIGGIIDRLDSVTNEEEQEVLRVFDYKTGNKEIKTIGSVEDIFDPKKIDNHSDYFLQAMFYSMLVRNCNKPYSYEGKEYKALNKANRPVQPAVIFVRKEESRKNPMLGFGPKKNKDYITDVKDYEEEFQEHLQRLIADILSADKPFVPTPYAKRCERCVFIRMCQGNSTVTTDEE